jgi:urease accessory protein
LHGVWYDKCDYYSLYAEKPNFRFHVEGGSKVNRNKLIALIALTALPGIASAHGLHDMASGGLLAGLFHPFSGADHLLAMLAVGMWASTLGGSAAWKVPGAFVVMLVAGCVVAMGGHALPLAEPLIAASVLVLGLVLMLALRASTVAGGILVGLFATFHGYAHGAELPQAASAWLYLLGMVGASIALHLGGVGIGHALKQHQWALRSGGALLAGAGTWLMVTV